MPIAPKIKQGQKFNKLTTILYFIPNDKRKSQGSSWWRCICDCGKELDVVERDLLNGKKISCGCHYRIPKENLIGQKFGLGEVIGIEQPYDSHWYWKLKCNCGKTYFCLTSKLKSLHTRSCGCLKRKNLAGNISSRHWSEIKKGAISRGIEFNISCEYAWSIFEKQNKKCALSGLDIYFAKDYDSHKISRDFTASLDRIDNLNGYVEGNVQWVHKVINYMKHIQSAELFVYLCRCVVANTKDLILPQNIIIPTKIHRQNHAENSI